MPTPTRALLACIALVLSAATVASAEANSASFWSSMAPKSPVSQSAGSSESFVNPLSSERSREEVARDQRRVEQLSEVDFATARFGRITAPRRIGTIEHAYGQFSYDQVANRVEIASSLDTLPTSRTGSRTPSIEELGVEFNDETPEEVRRILAVLLKGVDADRASAYVAWAQNLSTQHLDAALAEISEMVDQLERQKQLNREHARRLAQIRQSTEFREAIAQLRAANTLAGIRENSEGTSPNDNLRGILNSTTENTERDREALRRVLIGRIAPAEDAISE